MSASLRAQWMIGRYGRLIVAILVLLGLAGIGTAAIAYAEPSYERTTTQAHQQTIATNLETSAVVTGNGSSLYDNGTVLQDKPAYLLTWTPNLRLTVETRVPEGVDTRLTERLVLELKGTRDGETFWDEDRVLLNQTRQVRGGVASTNVSLNVSEIDRELTDLRTEVGEIGVFETRMRLTVEYSTNRYSGSLSGSGPLQITERAYWLDGEFSADRSHSTPVTERVEQPSSLTSYLVPGVAGLLSFVLGGVVMLRARDVDVAQIETDLDRMRYQEWISEGEFPTGPNKRHIRITELEDLVDVAIDSNKRVIYDEAYQVFAVADGDIVYYFAENPDRVEGWLDL